MSFASRLLAVAMSGKRRDRSSLLQPLGCAQQLAEADPAGWRIGCGAWPAGVRDNQWKPARFRRAA